jgi:hypothetical protein
LRRKGGKRQDMRRRLQKGRRPGMRLKGYKAAGCHKKKMMKMTFRMGRQARGGAAK